MKMERLEIKEFLDDIERDLNELNFQLRNEFEAHKIYSEQNLAKLFKNPTNLIDPALVDVNNCLFSTDLMLDHIHNKLNTQNTKTSQSCHMFENQDQLNKTQTIKPSLPFLQEKELQTIINSKTANSIVILWNKNVSQVNKQHVFANLCKVFVEKANNSKQEKIKLSVDLSTAINIKNNCKFVRDLSPMYKEFFVSLENFVLISQILFANHENDFSFRIDRKWVISMKVKSGNLANESYYTEMNSKFNFPDSEAQGIRDTIFLNLKA